MFGAPLILHRDHRAGFHVLILILHRHNGVWLHVLMLILHQVADVLTQDELLVDSLEMSGATVSERKWPQADWKLVRLVSCVGLPVSLQKPFLWEGHVANLTRIGFVQFVFWVQDFPIFLQGNVYKFGLAWNFSRNIKKSSRTFVRLAGQSCKMYDDLL